MPNESSWKDAIIDVLERAGESMHFEDIAKEIKSLGLRQNLGATPAATVRALVYRSIDVLGVKSPFLKVGRGEIILRALNEKPTPASEASERYDRKEKQYEIISSFGMSWRRDYVLWTSKPRLLGVSLDGADTVDFNAQQGIYLLYDSREVVYVGRATDRLGSRLYDHTRGPLSARWDMFSWFGFLPVAENGALGGMPEVYQSGQIIPALEAILIEAMEPRKNRRRGDGLSEAEYYQKEDDKLKAQRERQMLRSLLDKANG